MKLKPAWLILLIILLVWLQLTAFGSASLFGGRINLLLAAVIILINLMDFSWALIFAIIGGLFLDVYSGLPFGILTLTLFLTAVVVEILFLNFFTNFSFYSLLLVGLIATLVYNLLFLAIIVVIYFLGWSDFLPGWDFLSKFLWQAVTTELIMIVAYFIINRSSRKFRPIFLK
jgi:hypothetical protein